MEIIFTDGNDERFTKLCDELDCFLNEKIGIENQKKQYNKYNSTSEINDVVIIIEGGQTVACGAFKKYDNESVEIKRVFVKESFRKHGLGKKVMSILENKAKEKGYIKLILETGKLLKAAQKLYTLLGFEMIPNYGQYKDMTGSVCMKKVLK